MITPFETLGIALVLLGLVAGIVSKINRPLFTSNRRRSARRRRSWRCL